jgi:nucleoside-diphosphate-sugar epimerase
MEEGSNLSNNNSSSSRSEYPVHIFRSGGIYGPLRNVLQSRSKAENVEKRRKETYVSRCHILDLVQVLIESIRKPKPGIYNVVDDCPSTRDAVTRFSLDLLEKVARSAETPSVSSSNSFPHWDLDYAQQQQAQSTRMDAAIDGLHTTGKRVSNQKVKSELGIVLEHPSYVEGMAAIIGGNIRPFSKELLTAYTQGIPK